MSMDKVTIPLLLIFFIGFMLMLRKSAKGGIVPKISDRFIFIARVTAILCLFSALSMIADLAIPKDTFEVTVVKTLDSKTISFGIYSEAMNKTAYNTLQNGEKVQIEVSKIYDEIKRIVLLEKNNEILSFPTVDDYAFLFMIFIFIAPTLLLFKKSFSSEMEKYFYSVLSVLSIILGFMSIIILIKFILVHILHVVKIM